MLKTQSNQYDAFMSHSSRDKAVVEDLAHALQSRAPIRTFLDRWHLTPGEPWQEELEAALSNSKSCVVAIGPGGLGPWQNVEMRVALERKVAGKKGGVIPVLLPGANGNDIDALPLFLKRLHMVDLRGGLSDEWALNQLVCGIQGRPPGPDATVQSRPVVFQIVISAKVGEADLPFLQALTEHLQEVTGDTRLTIVKVESGSIVLTLTADSKSYELLLALFQQGKLAHLAGFSVASVRLRSESGAPDGTPSPGADAISVSHAAPSSRRSVKLYVGNLSYSVRDDALQKVFSSLGSVSSAKVMMDRDTGRSKGFGFVEISPNTTLQEVLDATNGQPLEGRTMVVNEARPREDLPGSFRSGGGGGFGGGGRGYGGGRGGRFGGGGYGGDQSA